MGRKDDHSGNIRTRFQTSLVAGLLEHRRQKSRNFPGKHPVQDTHMSESGAACVKACPKTKYTNATGAAEYLGVSKATFFRHRANGHFPPSPITGRYHLDDLDREARGTLSIRNGHDAADAQTQKTFGKSETTPLLAHGGQKSPQVSLE